MTEVSFNQLLTDVARELADLLRKYNPYRDPRTGRFTTGPSRQGERGTTRRGTSRRESQGSRARSERAKRTHKPSTKEKQRRGEAEQARLAKVIGGRDEGDNKPFDVIVGRHGIEVKTVMDNNNDKITVHPSSRRRKEAEAKRRGLKMHTVAIDVRGGRRKYYYREGVGAFRLRSMRKVTVAELKKLLSE